jgi:hypothetical protein
MEAGDGTTRANLKIESRISNERSWLEPNQITQGFSYPEGILEYVSRGTLGGSIHLRWDEQPWRWHPLSSGDQSGREYACKGGRSNVDYQLF